MNSKRIGKANKRNTSFIHFEKEKELIIRFLPDDITAGFF